MQSKKKEAEKNSPAGQHEKEMEKAIKAHEQADKDIGKDPDLTTSPKPEDDLDEGELARLEGED